MRRGEEISTALPTFLVCLGFLVYLPTPILAQFREPDRLSSGNGIRGPYAVGIDPFGNLNFATRESRGLVLVTFTSNLRLESLISTAGIEPDLAFSSLDLFLAYAEQRAGESGDLHEIRLTKRVGPTLALPTTVSTGGGDHRCPRVRLDSSRVPVVVWEERQAAQRSRVLLRRGLGPVQVVGAGAKPTFEIDGDDRIHVFFLREGALYHASGAQPGSGIGFADPRRVPGDPGGSRFGPSSGITEDDVLYVCYDGEDSLYLVRLAEGRFSEPELLSPGDVRHSRLHVDASDILSIAFEKAGDIYHVLANDDLVLDPQPVVQSSEVEMEPAIVTDAFVNVMVMFKRENEVYLTTNATPPQAQFVMDPDHGEAPLEVRFVDKSVGDVTMWHWDFGDGETSRERNPVHVFRESGEYSVSLSVRGPGGESATSGEAAVVVTDPRNRMWIGETRALPGLQSLYVPVLATHDEPIQGYQLAATYDPQVVKVLEVDFEATNIAGLQAELLAFNVSDDPDDPFVTAGVLFDIEPPFDERKLPPGTAQRVANIIVNISPRIEPGSTTAITLRNGLGRPPLNNILTVNSFTVLPALGKPGIIHIEPFVFPLPRFFVRGDSDQDGVVNLSDAINTLSFLFAGIANLECLDPADANDNGSVDLSDAIFVLSFLFQAGSYPPPPFPNPGLDPTPDDLEMCFFQ